MSNKRKGPGGGRPGGPLRDPWQDPRAQRWLERVRTELLPMLDSSGAAVSICPPEDSEINVQFCVELGAMILMNKPIILAVPPGRRIPDKLARVADEIVELDLDSPTSRQRMADAIARVDPQDPGVIEEAG